MEKKQYKAPRIEFIELDNEISLALESAPPVGPSETVLTPDYIKNDPFRSTNA